jgi:hypothetical protein
MAFCPLEITWFFMGPIPRLLHLHWNQSLWKSLLFNVIPFILLNSTFSLYLSQALHEKILMWLSRGRSEHSFTTIVPSITLWEITRESKCPSLQNFVHVVTMWNLKLITKSLAAGLEKHKPVLRGGKKSFCTRVVAKG